MPLQDRTSICETKVFCKADIFPFHVISLPFLNSNLDTKICYKVFYGQIVRFQRLCSFKIDFEARTKFLLDILLKRGYKGFLLKREFCKAVEKYLGEFQKWILPYNFQNWFDLISNTNFGQISQDDSSSSQSQNFLSQLFGFILQLGPLIWPATIFSYYR